MPERKFALEQGGPDRVTCRWEGLSFKNFQVLVDGDEIGRFADKAALMQGATFRARDGGEFFVQFAQGFGTAELKVQRNGAPLPGSDADPTQAAKQAGSLVYFIGGLNLVLGVLAMAGVEFLRNIGLGLATVLLGMLYVVLGYFTRQSSRLALGAAMAMFALDGLAGMAVTVGDGRTPPVGGIIFRVFLLIAMGKAFAVIGSKPANAPSQQLYR